MWRILGSASFVAVALLVMAPAGGLGQNKNQNQAWTKGTPMPATPQDYSALMNVKQLPGTVYYIDNGSGSKVLTLRVDIPQYTPNPSYRPPNLNNIRTTNNNNGRNNSNHSQQMNHLMQQYHQAMNTHVKSPAQMQQHQAKLAQIQMQMQNLEMQQMMQQGMQAQNYQMQVMARMAQSNTPNNQPFKVNITQKDFELDILDNVSVRKTFLGTDYDDMGNPKSYTKAQLAELKGKDSSKPGYNAKFDDLQPGQEVTLYLSKPAKKSASASSASKADVKKVDDEKKADEVKKADDEKKADEVKKAGDEKKGVEEKAAGLVDPLPAPPAKADRPVITMIVMTKENTSPLTAAQAPAKKKKN